MLAVQPPSLRVSSTWPDSSPERPLRTIGPDPIGREIERPRSRRFGCRKWANTAIPPVAIRTFSPPITAGTTPEQKSENSQQAKGAFSATIAGVLGICMAESGEMARPKGFEPLPPRFVVWAEALKSPGLLP